MKRLNTKQTKNQVLEPGGRLRIFAGWNLCIIILLLILAPLDLFTAPQTTRTSQETFHEFQVKATLIQTIAMFIEWPKNLDVDDTSKPFTIGIIGNTPLTKEILKFYVNDSQLIKDKEVKIREVSDKDNIPPCNLLFISRSARIRLPRIIAEIENSPILTIGDTEGFADRGIHINFIIRHQKVRFEVNQKAVEKSGLVASHHLLKAAERVIVPTKKEEIPGSQ
ncbi:MAG: YfiR family protein [Candidatus Aminicenantes bacterium]|nr:MAG: YfiR family protein [Candidatus Aminicenantes bacterium]